MNSGFAGKLAVLGLGLAAMLLVAWLGGLLILQQLGQSAFFQLTAIKIDGGVRTTKKEVLALSGLDVHSNLLALSVGGLRQRLEAHDWIESAEVRRQWPSRLQITIRERRPLAILSLPDGLYYTDHQGLPFAPAVPPEELDFPVITGLGQVALWPEEQRQALRRALRLIRLAARGGVILPAQGISEINLGQDGAMTLFLVSRPFPVYLGREPEVALSYNRLVRVLDWLYKEREFARTAAIRMDYLPGRVLVEK
ncbi:cell division protein FtsQ/DivIB [Desulfurivibrio alkaliphilus]|uniref:cell division protein FtsQ/DivIB n=1 Tax=Desulfurivibrio alkaliphilus TaxID=427923 RepID=UPI00031DB6D9|nr:FtsQ-type POTRA domain-containing protein [Desulfurivibrio alkaliphilus]